MGNRATVIFWNGDRDKPRMSPAVYLHWNGGPESVYGFLEELDRRGVRADQEYEVARFVQLVGEFFTWSGPPATDDIHRESAYGLSLGVVNGPASDALEDLERVQTDHGDNGVYLVCRIFGVVNPVRRFTEARYVREGWSGEDADWTTGDTLYRLREMTPEEVERERKEAEASDYRPAFREFFARLETCAPDSTIHTLRPGAGARMSVRSAYLHGHSDGYAEGAEDYRFNAALVSEKVAALEPELRHARDYVQVSQSGERTPLPDPQAYRAYQVGFARGYRCAVGVGGRT